MGLLNTLRFMISHPLTRDRPLAALGRFAKWQVECRLRDEVIHEWIEGSKLAVRKGMTGATGNIYCGLHEFADMAFVAHLLRPEDLFIDVGANVGSYTVLAAAVARADVVAFEPDPDTMVFLKRNIELNRIGGRVQTEECALGASAGTARFTVGRDTRNKVASQEDEVTRVVAVQTLDCVVRGRNPILIKLDVEGYEAEVLAGASQTLSNPTLLAVETEDASTKVRDCLKSYGFLEFYYDPFDHALGDVPVHRSSNKLFLRQVSSVRARVEAIRLRVLDRLL